MNRLLIVLVFSAPYFLLAQQKEYIFTKITKEFRLASNKVSSIIKDHNGYLWIASDNGLQRYDGRNIMHFWHEAGDTSSLPDNNVSRLLIDYKNRLWLNSGGFPCYYEPVHRNFKKVRVETNTPTVNIFSFYQDSRNLLWMITGDSGLFVLDTVKNIFRQYNFVLPQYAGKVFNIIEDTLNNYYWLSTTAGLAIYDLKKKVYYNKMNNPLNYPVFSNDIHVGGSLVMNLDQNNILWLQTWEASKGYLHFRYDIKKKALLQLAQLNERLWGWVTDVSGTTWAYGSALARYDNKKNSFIKIPAKRNSLYGIDYNDIGFMYEDNEKNLWIATNLGLYYFNPYRQVFNTSTLDQQSDANINSFIETSDGQIIMPKWGGEGLVFLDSNFNRVSPLYGFRPMASKDGNYSLTWCGLQDNMGLIWIGGQHGRIIQLDPQLKKTNFLNPPEFENKTIRSITEDRYGNIWFGTQNNIIIKWERSTEQFKQIISLSREKYRLGWIIRLLPGNNNDIWAATLTGGLLHIDGITGKILEQFLPDISNSQSISSADVKDITAFGEDTLVLATSKGFDLFDINSKSFLHIAAAGGPPTEGVVAIIADEKKNIWYSSSDGISRLNIYRKRVKNFNAGDGITELDFQPGSVYRFKNGTIAFGNTRGFVSFDPKNVTDTGTPADVVITGFRVLNNNMSVDSLFQNGNQIRLKNSQNYFLIRFASMNNLMNNQPVYFYKLEGADEDWIQSTSQEAVYTYLPGGNYNFKVKCVSPDGVESKGITSFKIYIEPPVYLKWWFIMLLATAAGLVIYYIYLLRRRRRNERELIRNRIARDLHDDMGSTLSTINILSSMAKTKMTDDPKKTSEYISKISDNSQRMMEAMDDIVWAIKPDNDNMQKITARMREFATGILEARDMELVFKVDEKVNDIKLSMETRRDFFLIFKEAVNNVAKYSHCSICEIQISIHQNRLLLVITDNGIGFDLANADNGNGLSNMQKRAEALKGRTSIQSKSGEGTKVTVNIPVQ